ncbi:MAG: thioredoxin family protein [Spirochaetia bacterium]
MKRIALLTTLFAAMAIIASAQSMSDSSSGSGNDNSSTMAPADSMSGTPAKKGSSDSMMAAMDYETLKKEGKLADPKMGMQLRIAMSSGMKVSYKNLMSAEGLANKNPTVLFFAADWCPSCQADLKDINANGAQLGKVNVVVVDYDKNADLKKKYGITVQDTFVQIGPMGEKLAIWNGGGVQGILNNIKQPM